MLPVVNASGLTAMTLAVVAEGMAMRRDVPFPVLLISTAAAVEAWLSERRVAPTEAAFRFKTWTRERVDASALPDTTDSTDAVVSESAVMVAVFNVVVLEVMSRQAFAVILRAGWPAGACTISSAAEPVALRLVLLMATTLRSPVSEELELISSALPVVSAFAVIVALPVVNAFAVNEKAGVVVAVEVSASDPLSAKMAELF